jgi:hypothetical protein
MTLQGAIRRKVYGPYESIQEVSGEGRIYLSLPYTEVMGSQVMLSVKDNWAKFVNANLGMYWPTLELTIWGAVQGFETVVKRQQTRMQTGPMFYIFDYAEAFDTVNFRARNISGGRRGPPSNAGEDTSIPDKRNQFSLTVDVYIQPRGGFASPENDAKTIRHDKKIRMG